MFEENIKKISALIQLLSDRFPIEKLSDTVIFGSAAITLNGKDLQRPIDDLDIFASDSAYIRLKNKSIISEVEKSPGVAFLKVGVPKIEIWRTFPGVNFQKVKARANKLEHSFGLPVASLEDLRIWKKEQGRPKDIDDLIKME
jgi:hypothetical protein